jgi:hypothetical protein
MLPQLSPRRNSLARLMRRLDRLAAKTNPYLLAAAVALGLLDLTCLTARLISPPAL